MIDELKYPDYRHDLEPSDEENRRLDRLIEKKNGRKLKMIDKFGRKKLIEQDDYLDDSKSETDSMYKH